MVLSLCSHVSARTGQRGHKRGAAVPRFSLVEHCGREKVCLIVAKKWDLTQWIAMSLYRNHPCFPWCHPAVTNGQIFAGGLCWAPRGPRAGRAAVPGGRVRPEMAVLRQGQLYGRWSCSLGTAKRRLGSEGKITEVAVLSWFGTSS